MKIALDAMGGDMAPQATIKGAIDALDKSKNKELNIILLGNEKIINEFLGNNISSSLSIVHCTDEVTMHDNGSKIIKSKSDSSMVKGITLLKEKKQMLLLVLEIQVHKWLHLFLFLVELRMLKDQVLQFIFNH